MLLRFWKSFFFTQFFFFCCGCLVFGFLVAHFLPILLPWVKAALVLLGAVFLVDSFLLWRGFGIQAERHVGDRLSNGDANEVKIQIVSAYPIPLNVHVIDEVPKQFQERSFEMETMLPPHGAKTLFYSLRPTKRGEYNFGGLNILVASPIGFLQRRYIFDVDKPVAVYPAFLQLKKYEFLAFADRLSEIGIKQVRRIGQATHFDHIRNYVVGDDPRHVNWKATARKSDLMVNQYEDEKSQNIVSILDLGRVMKMPFEQMTLLDHAVNATLVLSHIALLKEDKAGLVTFGNGIKASVKPDKNKGQSAKIIDALYKVDTGFPESDLAFLIPHIRKMLPHRSLLLFFTNFESEGALKRQLPFLQILAKRHLVVVIFFENTEIKHLIEGSPQNTEGVYIQTIAEKAAFEKREIVRMLQRHGIQSILTPPNELTVNTINKYLELKARGMI